MNELNATLDKEHEEKIQSASNPILFVSFSIILMMAFGVFALDLFSYGSKNSETENVAIDAYKSYSQKLNAISKKYSEELDTIEKVN